MFQHINKWLINGPNLFFKKLEQPLFCKFNMVSYQNNGEFDKIYLFLMDKRYKLL